MSMGIRKKEALTGALFALIPLAGLLAFFFIPFMISIYLTLYAGMGAYFAGLQNYMNLFASEAFRLAVKNTMRFIGAGSPLLMALSLFAALALTGRLKGKIMLRSMLALPMAVPPVSVILFYRVLFERNGAMNYILNSLGMAPVDFLSSGNAFYILLLLYVWKNLGYNMILFMAGLSQIPGEFYEAAGMDGAGPVKRFMYITLPLIAPVSFFVFVMTIIQAFRSFREIFALSGLYPDLSIYMLQHFMNNNFLNLNYQRLGSAAFLTFIFIFAIVGLLFLLRKKTGDYEL